VVWFADEAARDRWQQPVKTAFRWLADSGFGGERSRGWGRSEAPEFIEGTLPELILPAMAPAGGPSVETLPTEAPDADIESSATPSASELESLAREIEEPGGAGATACQPQESISPSPENGDAPKGEGSAANAARETAGSVGLLELEAPVEVEATDEAPVPEPQPEAVGTLEAGAKAHWLLSLFTPSGQDAVDWARGNYWLVERSGRVDSPAGAGELKKTLRMVGEGSVVYAKAAPHGSAPDVAPDGFPHPVFRAGFAVSVPLPEVS